MRSESAALGFSFPFKLQIVSTVEYSWHLFPFGGGNCQVSFHCKATEKQLEPVKQTVHCQVHTYEEARGPDTVGFRSPDNTVASSSPSLDAALLHGGALWWLLVTPVVKS